MVDEIFRLLKAFIIKTKETSFINAVKISFIYLTNKKSLYKNSAEADYPNFKGSRETIFLNPLVSILIVSYNSGEDLEELCESINKQTYKNLELILVENGTQNTEVYLESLKFPYKYVSSSNIGFAAANNLAFEHSNGDYVCLVNPDTILDPSVIEQLLKNLKIGKNIVASVPKIVFYHRFIDLEINSDVQFNIDVNALINSLNYKKYFIKNGQKLNIEGDSVIFSDKNTNSIVLTLPIDQSKFHIRIRKSLENQTFSYKINNSIKNNSIISKNNEEDFMNIFINSSNKDLNWKGKYVINNAGSGLRNKNPYDRGFGNYDLGHFDNPEFVDALCGCVAMLSPQIFSQRKIFIDEFFAYYEDSELSSWILEKKLKIRYVPLALVKHKHSASTEEGSLLWTTFVQRSKAIYDSCTNKNFTKFTSNSIKDNYLKIPNNLSTTLRNYDSDLINKTRKNLYKKKKPSAGIYNSFWNTMGGGEKHALSIAKLLSKQYEVYLLSESDFDDEKLKKYFSIDFKFRKIIRDNFDSLYTKNFDLFVNSTYCSSLESSCPKSIYLVSFPHKVINKSFLKSYHFFHNSTFTQKWAQKYWGKHKNSVLYPITEMEFFHKSIEVDNHELKNANQNIISIGRFTPNGHTKRHDIILHAFNKAQKATNSDFKLFLVGSLDSSIRDDLRYFESLNNEKCKNVYLFPNLEFNKLQELLSISKFYIQATGIGIDSGKDPQLLEHFGISLIEAIIYNNYPIIYDKGGPAETLKILNIGEKFNDFNSLVNILKKVMDDSNSKKYKVKDNLLLPLRKINEKSLEIINDSFLNN